MILLIAEKPSLARSIAGALGSNFKKNSEGFLENEKYIVAHQVGHVLEYDIPNQKWSIANLPIVFKDLRLVPKSDKRQLVKDLAKSIKRPDIKEIVSAGDADQEGSLLIHEMLVYSGAYNLKNVHVSRIWIQALDNASIVKAFNERYSIDKDKPFIYAGEGRSYADLSIGLNFTQLSTLLYGNGQMISIGRVQTPTLKLVRMREQQIEGFVPQKYFTIKGVFDVIGEARMFYLDKDEKLQTRFFDPNFNWENLLTDDAFWVETVEEEKKTVKPDLLPNLNAILSEVSKKYRLKAKHITDDIQYLYEHKLVTYPRSESRHLPLSMAEQVKFLLNSFNVPAASFSQTKRVFDDSKVESHFAIIPMVNIAPDSLSDSQKIIFDFICSKFVMAFMPDYEYMTTSIYLKNTLNANFLIQGQRVINQGFKTLNQDEIEKDVHLPLVNQGQKLNLLSYFKKEDFTKPPVLLTEAELLDVMEHIYRIHNRDLEEKDGVKFSLGTPATRGGIIELLFKRNYMVADKKGYLSTTSIGRHLLEVFSQNIGVELTARFEQDMLQIQKGSQGKDEFLNKIDAYVRDTVAKSVKGGAVEFKKEGFFENDKTFSFWKDGLEISIWKISFGRKFSSSEAKKLFDGQVLQLDGFVSTKTNNKYAAKCIFDFEAKKLKLKFD